MKRGAPTHPKVYDLASRMNIPHALAVGYLELLWHFTARYAPQGDIGRHSDEIIAKACLYQGVASRLVSAMCAAGWLEVSGRYRLVVHDWHDHADEATKKSLLRKGLPFLSLPEHLTGHDTDKDRTLTEHGQDSVRKLSASRAPVPLPKPEPSHIHPSQQAALPILDQDPIPLEGRNGELSVGKYRGKQVLSKQQLGWFDAWWSVVWAKTARGDAEKAFAKAVTSHDVFTAVMEATKRQAPLFRQRERQYQPHPATWLNGRRWLDEPADPAEIPAGEEESIRFVPKPRPVSTEPDEPLDLSWIASSAKEVAQ